MRILALDAALARCSAALVVDGELRAVRESEARQGQAALLPRFAEAVLAQSEGESEGEGETPAPPVDLVAVTIGPGSFTGIRAALSLAHGFALAACVPLVGVTVGEALAGALPHLGGRALWSAVAARRGRVFLEHGGAVAAFALDALPDLTGRLALAGDAAVEVAGRLAARGLDVMLTDARFPAPRQIAVAALARHAGRLPPRPAQPLYVDPPEARPAAAGLRAPPIVAAG